MEKNPLFSVVTVTLNNFGGLRETGASLNEATGNDWEWIVIDGASTDGTADWLKNDKTASIWVSEPDSGLYDAMNKGIERARGEYILFLNAGDRLAGSGTFNRIARAAIGNNNPDFLYGDSEEPTDSGEVFYKKARSHDRMALGLFTHHQAMFYRRELLKDLRFDGQYKIAADYDFTARFLKKARTILYIPAPVCVFEPGGVSQRNAAAGRREEFRIKRRLGLCGPVRGRLIFARQFLAWGLRRLFPDFYARVRSSGNSARG
ncbi:MAG: glycosyltransferase [Alphaproteobacteria bacterium]|nr:glycosyltransferase [Alphaproteobacteria bacterium]